MLAFILLLLAAGMVTFWSHRLPRLARAMLVPLPALGAFGLLAWLGSQAAMPAETYPWFPSLGLELALQLHGLGLLLALLVTGIGALVLAYAVGYKDDHPQANRLFAFLYAFMLAMVGLAISDHLVVLFVFWELTSITSYLLIGFNHAEPYARKNALQALLVTGLGGMGMLAGFILLGSTTGTWRISELATHHAAILAHPAYLWMLALVLLGAFTKSAQFPFHFWLPNAMAAPTPVSAYLHSATMVKAGVFLMALFLPILGGTAAWTWALGLSGGITLLLGGIFGLQQSDLKKMLAGTTLAVLGLLTLLLGLGTAAAVKAAMLFLLGHAFYKAALFMVTGSIDHATGTREITLLGGLRRAMPWTAAAALLAGISKMGLPPFLGFLGKEYTYKAGLASVAEPLVTTVLVVGNVLLVALAIKVAVVPFWSAPKGELPHAPHEVPWTMRLGPLVLAGLGLTLGALPHLAEPLVAGAMHTALGKPYPVEIKLWQGFNLPLLLSAVTVAAGATVAWQAASLRTWLQKVPLKTGEKLYQAALDGTLGLARLSTRSLQSGQLRNYLLIILGTTLLMVGSVVWPWLADPLPGSITPVPMVLWVVVALMMTGTAMAISTDSRLTALVSLGMVGFGVAMLFALFSAPDLAITQILVETLTVVLFAWVVYKLPDFRSLSSKAERLTDLAIAGGTGVLVTFLVLKSKSVDLAPRISDQLAQWSLPEGQGANVVNVILVDFRALDTWGEITVLAIAAIGVWSLLQMRAQPKEPKP